MLYEARIFLIASAEAPPEEIYIAGDGTFEVPAHGLAPDRNAELGAHRQPQAAVRQRA
jgi:predicted ATPase